MMMGARKGNKEESTWLRREVHNSKDDVARVV